MGLAHQTLISLLRLKAYQTHVKERTLYAEFESAVDCFKPRFIFMSRDPVLNVSFFRTDVGRAPVQQWLKSLDDTDRKVIGEDIRFVQFGWPLGMPHVRKMEEHLWEIRSRLSKRRIARILFTVRDSKMILSFYMASSRSLKGPHRRI